LFWAAAQIHAFGDVVAVNSDGTISPTVGIAIAAGIAIVYTVSGGLMADVYTDVLQATILIGGLVALFVSVLLALPEMPAESAAAAVAPNHDSSPPLLDMLEAWAIPILGSIVAQEAISRTLAARSAATARNSALLGGSIYLLVGAIPLTIGLLGPRLLPDLADPEAILPTLSKEHLPTWLNFVFAGALIAAILSTVDSCLLVVSSIAVRNLAPHVDDRSQDRLRAARVAVVVAGLAAYGLANTDWNVGDLVEQASGFGSAGVFVLAVLATRGRIGGPIAANGALLAGASSWVLGRYLAPDTFDHPYLASLAAAAGGFALGVGIERMRGSGTTKPN
jgi:Na+/proline symporter